MNLRYKYYLPDLKLHPWNNPTQIRQSVIPISSQVDHPSLPGGICYQEQNVAVGFDSQIPFQNFQDVLAFL